MIARTWTGTVRRSDADEYAEYIRETGFAEYGQTPGNRGAWMLRRDEGERTEFITLSLWESEDAIRSFAGDDIEAAVLYPGPIFTSGCRAGMFLCRPWRCASCGAGCWARSSRGRYRSEAAGIVLGVATTAGFASLETMGHGFASWLFSKDNLAVLDEVLLVRGLTSPAGHMAWTALVCAVLWRERLKVLHALWDTFASVRSPTPVGAPAGRIETLELVAGGVLIPPGVLRRARRPTRARSLPLPSSLRSQ